MAKETGHRGKITSLGGIDGLENTGLTLYNRRRATWVGAANNPIVGPNPLRKWLFLQANPDNNEPIYLMLGLDTVYVAILTPGDAFLINDDLSWTGSVNAYVTATFAGSLEGIEAVVEGGG